MRRRPALACAAALLGASLAACGLEAQDEPTPLPPDQLPAELDGEPGPEQPDG